MPISISYIDPEELYGIVGDAPFVIQDPHGEAIWQLFPVQKVLVVFLWDDEGKDYHPVAQFDTESGKGIPLSGVTLEDYFELPNLSQ